MPTMVPTKIALRCSYSCIEEGPARYQAREPRAHHGAALTMREEHETTEKWIELTRAEDMAYS